ncbi:TetR family transcriptional regulator [Phyllobacterium myrsinacearum]|uniref:TetR/AcrR family transcriptional regulator C-terminal domain-containing protein n=1 Tax=Phyllobacterium myrsinacearum TaxID=28101 RepID=UPI001029F765|nr:TetR/AcrR family transcriptional regulator C-terminal domain-containing protein [Phyllobacterium myrsinacearum]RZS79893.1 TetR family transcriptional regulator [Phyllobacterium myrsinacearum]
MRKLNRETVIAEALALLDEVGLDRISTRLLAKRLGVEQPSLYWHFPKKDALLAEMAQAAMAPHALAPLPMIGDNWYDWFLENTRSFRRTLLIRRDGARLHAGTYPGEADTQRIIHKIAFLVSCGLSEQHAKIAMLAASHFTVGSVLEEQAASAITSSATAHPQIDYEAAFEEGLMLILDGLAVRERRG